AQVLDGNHLVCSEGIVVRDRKKVVFPGNGEILQRANVAHQPDEADIRVSPFKILDDVVGGVAFDVDAHVGKFATQPLNEFWQDAECCGIDGADRQLAELLAGGELGQCGGGFDCIQDR